MAQLTAAKTLKRAGDARYRALFERSRDAMFEALTDGKFVRINQAAADLLAYRKDELLKISVRRICITPAAWNDLQKTADRNGYARNDRIRLRRGDGSEIMGMMSVTLKTNGDARPSGYQGIIHDMGTHEQESTALRENLERFRQLSDSAFEGLFIHEGGIILFANKAYAQFFGYEPHEMVGMPVLETVIPEDRDRVLARMMSAYEGFDEVPSIRRNGTEFLVEVSTRLMFYQGRQVLITAVRDITERRRMEHEFRESEEKLRIMFESMMEGVVVYDIDGHILQSNDALVRLHGFQTREELIGMNVMQIISSKDRPRARKNMKMRLKSYVRHNVEYMCLRKDGTEFAAELSISLVRDRGGNPSGFVAVIRDVTERMRYEQNLQFYVSEITRAHEEERRRLACELHDETIQSLVALSLEIESINKSPDLSQGTVRQLRLLQQKADEIISEVRRFSHELRPSVLDKLGLVAALDLLVAELKQKKVDARFHAAGTERRLPLETELALFRITQEALRNVWKHSSATECRVSVEFDPHAVRLTVKDNGKGFDPPEESGDLAARGKLGIIGMKERASLVGGVLGIESSPGNGTRLTAEVRV